MLISHAKLGRKVARLKGGDPLFFSRGGDEIEALRSAGIEYEIVPGVSSVFAAAACAGIPLTHRSYSSSVAFATGHEDREKLENRVKWREIAKTCDTLVILMGVENLDQIAYELISAGLDQQSRACAVESASMENQKIVYFTLKEAILHQVRLNPPSVIIVGRIVEEFGESGRKEEREEGKEEDCKIEEFQSLRVLDQSKIK
jgi:siroheme synthase